MSSYRHQTQPNENPEHRQTDDEIMLMAEKSGRVIHTLIDAFQLADRFLEDMNSATVGRVGTGQHLYPNKVPEFQQQAQDAVDEATRAVLARTAEARRAVEVPKVEVKPKDAVTQALSGIENNILNNNPTLPLDIESSRANLAEVFKNGVDFDEIERFANDPVNATKELI